MDHKKTIDFACDDVATLYQQIDGRVQGLIESLCESPAIQPRYVESIRKLAKIPVESGTVNPHVGYNNIQLLISAVAEELPQSDEKDRLIRQEGQLHAYNCCLYDLLKHRRRQK